MKLKDVYFKQGNVLFMLKDKKILTITKFGDNLKYEIRDRKLNIVKESEYMPFSKLKDTLNMDLWVFRIPNLSYVKNYNKMFSKFRSRVIFSQV